MAEPVVERAPDARPHVGANRNGRGAPLRRDSKRPLFPIGSTKHLELSLKQKEDERNAAIDALEFVDCSKPVRSIRRQIRAAQKTAWGAQPPSGRGGLRAQSVDKDVEEAKYARLPAWLTVHVAHSHQRAHEVFGTDVGADLASLDRAVQQRSHGLGQAFERVSGEFRGAVRRRARARLTSPSWWRQIPHSSATSAARRRSAARCQPSTARRTQ